MEHESKLVSCPSCGGEIPLTSQAAQVAHCPYCENTLVVNEAALRSVGKMALLAETPSCLAVGYPAKCLDRELIVLGRIQYQYDAGLWDEWWIQYDDDGSYAWISQDEGEFILEVPLPENVAVPAFEDYQAGDRLEFGGRKLWVKEKNEAAMVGMQGELPFPAERGGTMRFLELTDNKVAVTIEYFADGSHQAFQGRRLRAGHLTSDTDSIPLETHYPAPQLTHPSAERIVTSAEGIRTRAVDCPSCGGSVELRGGDGTSMLTCTFCTAVLDVSVPGTAQLLYEAEQKKIGFPIPLGAQGHLRGADYTVLGRVRYRDADESGVYVWDELQMHSSKDGYAFLALEEGHWMLFKPLRRTVTVDPRRLDAKHRFTFDGQSYRVFEQSAARITYVEGELSWVARLGDRIRYLDAIRPPYMLSAEWTPHEMEWTIGCYIDPHEVEQAFRIAPGKLPRRQGVAPAQPFRRTHDQRISLYAGLAASLLALVLMMLAFGTRGGTALPRVTATSAEYLSDQGFISPEFHLDKGSHICKVQIDSSNLNNSWVAASLAVLDEEDNVLVDADAMVERYYGSEGGESWSEGSMSDYALLRLDGPANYRLNLFGECGTWSAGGGDRTSSKGASINLVVYDDIVPARYFVTLLVLAGIYPVTEIARQIFFESQRWPSDDDDDDDE